MTGTSTAAKLGGAQLDQREQDRADRADRGRFGRRGEAAEDRAEHGDDQQHRRDQHLRPAARRARIRAVPPGSGGTAGDVFGQNTAMPIR